MRVERAKFFYDISYQRLKFTLKKCREKIQDKKENVIECVAAETNLLLWLSH